MSFHIIRGIKVEPNEVRDFYLPYVGADISKKWDLWQEYQVIGLDLMIHNRGASDITFDVDATGVDITVEAGSSISITNFKFSLLEITNSAGVTYQVRIVGIKKGGRKEWQS